ncbi:MULTISPECIES: signal peptidase I [Cellulomonas]|nr:MULTISPECIES: signal peptidase I [Cellulomonas]MCR6706117.1 signal peptidase I [Cellulomonas sp.]
MNSRADDEPAPAGANGASASASGGPWRAEAGGSPPHFETERDSMHETSAGAWPADPQLGEPSTEGGRGDGVTGGTEAGAEASSTTRAQRRLAERGRPARRSAGGSILRETAIILVSALVLSWLIKTFLVQAFFIPSSSMHDTLVEDDRIMVSKLTPGPFDLERGDIVVFKDPGGWLEGQKPVEATGWRGAMNDVFTFVGLYPQDAGEHLVKRVIGLPGDRVACAGPGEPVTVNGVALDEPYLAAGAIPSQMDFDITVPPNSLWVMGDNRQSSSDSRLHRGDPGGGSIPIGNVVGKAFVLVWPLDRATVLHNPGATFEDVPDAS